MPKGNRNYWKPKLERNVVKQKADIKALRKDDWKVGIVWECETREVNKLKRKLLKIL